MLTAPSYAKTLFPLIYEFNHLAIHHIHPSWFEQLPSAKEIAFLKDYSYSHSALSAFIKRVLNIDSQWFMEFEPQTARLVLMSNEELLCVARYLGIVCVSPLIKKVMGGGALRSLKSMLGEEGFEFSRKAAAFYHPHWLAQVVELEYPLIDDIPAVSRYVETAGLRCLALMIATEPVQLKQRFIFKFPKEQASLFDIQIVEDQMEKNMEESLSIFKIVKKLIKDLNLTCRPIFV